MTKRANEKERETGKLKLRRTARILTLLSIGQIKKKIKNRDDIKLEDLILDATRTLTLEVKSTIESASDDLNRGNDQLIKSETRTNNMVAARNMLKESISLTQKAINKLGQIMEVPTFIQVSHQNQVKSYAVELIQTIQEQKEEIDRIIDEVMVDWSLSRLTRIDGDIIRIAVAEMMILKLEHRVAINEAVEIAKEYSDDDGFRFINGVLRKVSNRLTKEEKEEKERRENSQDIQK